MHCKGFGRGARAVTLLPAPLSNAVSPAQEESEDGGGGSDASGYGGGGTARVRRGRGALWSQEDVKRVKRALLSLGFGRWSEVLATSGVKGPELADVQVRGSYGREMRRGKGVNQSRAPRSSGSSSAPAPLEPLPPAAPRAMSRASPPRARSCAQNPLSRFRFRFRRRPGPALPPPTLLPTTHPTVLPPSYSSPYASPYLSRTVAVLLLFSLQLGPSRAGGHRGGGGGEGGRSRVSGVSD